MGISGSFIIMSYLRLIIFINWNWDFDTSKSFITLKPIQDTLVRRVGISLKYTFIIIAELGLVFG